MPTKTKAKEKKKKEPEQLKTMRDAGFKFPTDRFKGPTEAELGVGLGRLHVVSLELDEHGGQASCVDRNGQKYSAQGISPEETLSNLYAEVKEKSKGK